MRKLEVLLNEAIVSNYSSKLLVVFFITKLCILLKLAVDETF